MTEDEITEIGIDAAGRLFVRPKAQEFPLIYRAGMGVQWDSAEQYLLSSEPREWSYAKWYNQILAAAATEYGVTLKLLPTTSWINVSDRVRSEIEASRG